MNILTEDNPVTRRRETIDRDSGEMLYWVAEAAIEQMRVLDDSIEPFGYYIKEIIMSTVPPVPPVATAPEPEIAPTLIEALNLKLHYAHLDLEAAEKRVAELDAEIEALPSHLRLLTAIEMRERVEAWYAGS